MSWFLKIDRIVFCWHLGDFSHPNRLTCQCVLPWNCSWKWMGIRESGGTWHTIFISRNEGWSIFPSRSPRLILKAKVCHCLLPYVIVWVWSDPPKSHVFKQLVHFCTHPPAKLFQKSSAEALSEYEYWSGSLTLLVERDNCLYLFCPSFFPVNSFYLTCFDMFFFWLMSYFLVRMPPKGTSALVMEVCLFIIIPDSKWEGDLLSTLSSISCSGLSCFCQQQYNLKVFTWFCRVT